METKASLIQAPVMPLLFRSRFPHDFIFGTASAAYQYEGAAKEEGRTDSIWDTFTHQQSDKIRDESNGDDAVDFYHRYHDDIKIMKEMGVNAFRFSISWSRVLTYKENCKGQLVVTENQRGVDFYTGLLNELHANGITPFVTLFHWDLPQALEDKYEGFLDEQIVEDFRYYSNFCFEKFGDKVSHWITLNEPWSFAYFGYGTGTAAPGRCSESINLDEITAYIPIDRSSYWRHRSPSGGNSATEPYIVAHNLLRAHAAAFHAYKDHCANPQLEQCGEIGITLNSRFALPKTQTKSDIEAARRFLDFLFGWFMEPLTTGHYPKPVEDIIKKRRLPLDLAELAAVKGTYDFLGLNYYTSNYATDAPRAEFGEESIMTDNEVEISYEQNGIPIGEKGCSDWIYNYPFGLRDLLIYIKENYHDPVIYITENGTNEVHSDGLAPGEALYDMYRVHYHFDHLCAIEQAIKKHGVKVKGYFAWSLLDNFEWGSGYTVRFGLHYVHYKKTQDFEIFERHPKLSALWFSILLKEPYIPFYALGN